MRPAFSVLFVQIRAQRLLTAPCVTDGGCRGRAHSWMGGQKMRHDALPVRAALGCTAGHVGGFVEMEMEMVVVPATPAPRKKDMQQSLAAT